MGSEKLCILLVSSESPFKYSAQMARDIVASLEEGGHTVDLLTKYADVRFTPAMQSVLDEPESQPIRRSGLVAWLKKTFPCLRKIHKPAFLRKGGVRHKEGYLIFDHDEQSPPVAPEQVAAKITKPYDLVIVLFWQNLLTAATLEAIYQKLGTLMLLMAVDMGPLTGGCHYFWDCRRFRSGCGCCPAISSSRTEDFTSANLLYKQQVYDAIRCVFLGNSWMNEFARQGTLFRNRPLEVVYPVIDEKQFRPLDCTEEAKRYFGIDPKHTFIFFAGSCVIEDKRKGFSYLVEAFAALRQKMSKDDLARVALVFAGNTQQSLQTCFPVKVYPLPYLDFADLTRMYALADAYLSPSIQDAGPMMVNQALMCGTPVVAFDMGVARDLVLNGKTGYKARYQDAVDFSAGIEQMLAQTSEQRKQMAKACRCIALETSSYAAFRHRIERCYSKYAIR